MSLLRLPTFSPPAQIIDGTPRHCPGSDTLQRTMIWKSLPESLYSSSEQAVPLFNCISLSKGLMIISQSQSLQSPSIPWSSIYQDQRLIFTAFQNLSQEIQCIQRCSGCGDMYSYDLTIIHIYSIPYVNPLVFQFNHCVSSTAIALRCFFS